MSKGEIDNEIEKVKKAKKNLDDKIKNSK
jgi:hypothetical protein